MTMRSRFFLLFLAVLLLLSFGLMGCGPDDEAATAEGRPGEQAATQETERPTERPGESTARLSPAFLAGPWCFAHTVAGDEREAENITYEFREDGTLLYQANSGTSVDQEGSYTIEGGQLSIKPALVVLPDEVLEASEDRFVLGSSSIQLVFERGPCASDQAGTSRP